MGQACAGDFVVGGVGLALLRDWYRADADARRGLIKDLERLLNAPEKPPLNIVFNVDDLETGEGYARWAENYDSVPNPLIRVEEPVVRAMIDAVPPGVAIDAACGTGRHAAYLAAKGHRVIGVDASLEMLARARQRLPDVDFREGDLSAIPLGSASADIVVCALALSHVPALGPPIAEMARVLRPGGRLILSDLNPVMVLLGGTAFFIGADGRAGNVKTVQHRHADYVRAFRAAELIITDCAEPLLEEQDLLAATGGLLGFAPEAFAKAYLGLTNALVWQVEKRG